jgi:AcrR family transcriptional regulator
MASDLPPPPPRGDYEQAFAWMRAAREVELQRRPGEGLREHKKRLMRQEMSDTATWMFARDGFDNVRIADVAARIGVSEKTIYNYYPTKESLVFDREDDVAASLREALGDREPGISPVQAMVQMMLDEWVRFGDVPEGGLWMLQAFDEMTTQTPALVAAERAMTNRLIDVAAESLAASAELDPRDPEVQVVANALLGLWDTSHVSLSRRVDEGLTGAELMTALRDDLQRAARVLETGLWAFDLVGQTRRSKKQFDDVLRSLDGARRQIGTAMREAREVWHAHQQAHEGGRQDERQAHREEMRRMREGIRAQTRVAKAEAMRRQATKAERSDKR